MQIQWAPRSALLPPSGMAKAKYYLAAGGQGVGSTPTMQPYVSTDDRVTCMYMTLLKSVL